MGGLINHGCKRGQYQYESVGVVDADSIEEAFVKSQNFDEEWCKLGVRSSCVGDIISVQMEGPTVFPKCYMMRGIGYDEVPHTVVSYIDWTNDQSTEPEVKDKLRCDDCTAEVDDSFGDPRKEIKFIQVDGEGNETIEVMKVCTFCIHDKYWGMEED